MPLFWIMLSVVSFICIMPFFPVIQERINNTLTFLDTSTPLHSIVALFTILSILLVLVVVVHVMAKRSR